MSIQTGFKFFAVEYGLLGGIRLYKGLWFKLLGGGQFWTDYHIQGAVAGAFFSYVFPKKILFVWDQISLGYSGTLFPNNYTSEARLGFGLSF